MPKIFSDENRDALRVKLLDNVFEMLKRVGLSSVNIDVLTANAYIAKAWYCAHGLIKLKQCL